MGRRKTKRVVTEEEKRAALEGLPRFPWQVEAAAAYERSNEGRAARGRSRHAEAEANAGLRGDRVAAVRMASVTALINQKRFERPPTVLEAGTGNLPILGAANTRELMINRQAIGTLRHRLGEGFAVSDRFAVLNNTETNRVLEELLKRFDEQKEHQAAVANKLDQSNRLLSRQNELMERDSHENLARPLPMAFPPNDTTRF
jgi:hypothetical protein